jgi:hypothetical protein
MSSVPALNRLAISSYDETTTYADRVHIVTLYVIEPHPMAPDVSPNSGSVWEMWYSTKRQPLVYEDRVAAAQETEGLLDGNQLVLVDDLTPGEQNNPVWCTYGPCPNCAYLIGQDGVIVTVQTWAFVDAMKSAIDQLLRPQQDYPGVANAKAAAYGSYSLTGSGIFNELGLIFLPAVAVLFLRIRGRRRQRP